MTGSLQDDVQRCKVKRAIESQPPRPPLTLPPAHPPSPLRPGLRVDRPPTTPTMALRLVVLLAATVAATATVASGAILLGFLDAPPDAVAVGNKCQMMDTCKGRVVLRPKDSWYWDGCGNALLFTKDCTVQDFPYDGGPGCPIKCSDSGAAVKWRQVGERYTCKRELLVVRPGCNAVVTATAAETSAFTFDKDAIDFGDGKCSFRDHCRGGKWVPTPVGEAYTDGCGNDNRFRPDCTVGVNDLEPGPGCPTYCRGVKTQRLVRSAFVCDLTLWEVRPGCHVGRLFGH